MCYRDVKPLTIDLPSISYHSENLSDFRRTILFLNFHPCSSAQAAIKSDSGMKAVCLAAAGLRNKKSGGIICLQVKNDVLFINTEGGGDEIIYENCFQLGIWKNSSGSSVLIR